MVGFEFNRRVFMPNKVPGAHVRRCMKPLKRMANDHSLSLSVSFWVWTDKYHFIT